MGEGQRSGMSGTGGIGVLRRSVVRRGARVRPDIRFRRGQRLLRVGLALCVLTVALLAWGAPALALSQRGHSFAFSFGRDGTEGGQFESPASVAASESTGDVYVTDSENNRIEQFSPEVGAEGEITGYKFVSAWGWGVANGGKAYERCTSISECKPGIKGGKFFNSPGQVAVDNSSETSDPSKGDVYVVANHHEEKGIVYKFGPNGEPVSAADKVNRRDELVSQSGTPLAEDEAPMALGTVEKEVLKCSKSFIECSEAEAKCKEEFEKLGTESCKWQWQRVEEGTEELGEELEVLEGVAVDAHGIVWVDGEGAEFWGFDGHGRKLENEPEASLVDIGAEGAPLRPGLAVASVIPLDGSGAATQDHLYFSYEPNGEEVEGKEGKFGLCREHPCLTAEMDGFEIEEDEEAGVPEEEEGRILNGEVGGKPTSGAALDPVDGEAYLDDGTSIATLGLKGSLVQSFGSAEAGFAGLEAGGAVAVDHAAGAEVGDVYALEPGTDAVEVFEPSSAGAPSVDALTADTVGSEAAVLKARIDPDGAKTSYVVQYTAAACTGPASSCSGEAPVPAGEVEGFGDRGVSIALSGLSPSTTYTVLVIAENEFGKTESTSRTFTTGSSPVEAALLDGRAWELVSPADKHGATIEPIRREGGLIQASTDGHSIAYVALGGPIGDNAPAGDRSPEPVQVIATREGAQWSSEDIATPNEAPAEGFHPGGPWEYQYFESDLSSALVSPISHVSLAPAQVPELTESGEPRRLYVRDNDPATCPPAPQTCYTPLVTSADDTANGVTNRKGEPLTIEDAQLELEAATPDLRRIVFYSSQPLTAEATNASSYGSGLYMWSERALQLISVLPSGQPEKTAQPFAGGNKLNGEMKATAISTNGSRVVWDGAGGLYMRELAHEGASAQTYEIAEPNVGVTPEGAAEPRFQTASADGSRVFFTDPQSLTANAASPRGSQQNLYVFEPEKPLGQRVKDLTPKPQDGEPVGVQGNVLGTSEDGAFVYFVADGVYGAATERGNCEQGDSPFGASCNLYAEHFAAGGWEAPRFVAQLSGEDLPDWGALGGVFNLGRQTSRVSPNGEYVAFMSSRSLTGYDNEDVNSETDGERMDEEVFLYGYADASLVCASCNPSHKRPRGMLDQENLVEPEGEGALVDRAESWQHVGSLEETEADQWLAGNIPGWTNVGNVGTFHQSRYLSNEGRLFFDSADPLVSVKVPTREVTVHGKKDKVGVENVYEYEPKGLGSCQTESAEGGCVALISSGESENESAFVEASESGEDVFFVTAGKLVAQDFDTAYDLYDARVCTDAEPCPAPSSGPPSPPCSGEVGAECRTGTSTPLAESQAPATDTPGSGNIVAKGETLAEKSVLKAKLPTRAQKLAKALKLCKKDKSKKKRLACARTARKRYGAKKAKKAASTRSGGKPS
jgi:hypothetical protein